MSDPLHVLYVEDDPLSREIMAVLMRVNFPNMALTMLEDSADFVSRIEALPNAPALFLLDIHIEPIDGFAMLQILRDDVRYTSARVVAVTASVMNQEVVQLRRAGFNGAIAKPLDFDRFATLIDGVLDGKEVWYVT